jgi:photosystem II stability/assembly factor-like uncharacterized protein
MARRRVLLTGFALVALAGCGAPSLEKSQWQPVALDGLAQVDLIDLAFSGEQGWLVGSRSTLLTSTDGGSTWKPKPLKLDGDVRFLSVSFSGLEGWICGEPKTLLHTTDGGDSWFRIPLDRRLPGNPMQVTALGPGTMEMVLDSGLVIRTVDGGKKFRVITPASAGGIRAAQRVADGSYWVVSTRGGSYLHWAPGDEQFTNYQRTSSRRIQNMGFSGQRGWMINQGGEMQFSEDGGQTWTPPSSVILNGIGLLDAAYDSKGNLWVTGGNGTLIVSADSGKSWKGDPLGGLKPTLTRVVFFGDRGFALGQNGALFRTQGA